MNLDVCKHWAGLMATPNLAPVTVCKAGVVYASIAQDGAEPLFRRLPCRGSGPSLCSRREFPTVEEISSWKAKLRERVTATLAACAIIAELRADHGTTAGSIDCPLCDNKLQYSIASSNGHISGACSTKDCLSWTQ